MSVGTKHVHIIGAGVIGLSIAWYLSEEGYKVTVIDQNLTKDGTSYGNAGLIVPSHFVPIAQPGAIWKGLKWMLSKSSPFAISTKLSLDLLHWLWLFKKSSTAEKVNAAARTLLDFHLLSRQLYIDLAHQPGFSFNLKQQGLLVIYQKTDVEAEELKVAERAECLGMQVDRHSSSSLQELLPQIATRALGAIHYRDDAHLNPRLFMECMHSALARKGVSFILGKTVTNFRKSRNKVVALVLKSGEVIQSDQIVISSGHQSEALSLKLGHRLPLQAGKGYSLAVTKSELPVSLPAILTEARVAITPLGEQTRVGGTLEIGNHSKRVKAARVKGIVESLPRYFPETDLTPFSKDDVWVGLRPCSPDGLPYLGALRSFPNVLVASGHAMMGMSLGPATGKVIAELIMNKKPSIDLAIFDVGRFR